MVKPETLVTEYEEPADVKIVEGFCGMGEEPLRELYGSLNLAMTFQDFLHIQNYFRQEEKRDPSMTEMFFPTRDPGWLPQDRWRLLRKAQSPWDGCGFRF